MLDDFVCDHDGKRRDHFDGVTPSPMPHAPEHADAAARDFVHTFTGSAKMRGLQDAT